ncbi:HD-GYP domain-containing protein [Desertibacillus haloalkaliphilus]|uniref:HD-GYP domain-containing protein n=1 Tax=Desertibacillus haloalkaliphilus TaxID=1328930 RepID=UPI001C25A0ED|nr:HD-GYP domain-containing protein [Desertibacillus haloalkaliphilus]MBU8906584.1 HD-GYP domain-containing protein [Desertibacillus haloalkaliphilus]
MRLIATKSLHENDSLGKAIYNDNGQVLIRSGVPLSQRMIDRLLEIGVAFVYVKDEKTDDIEVNDVITEKTRQRAFQTIKTEFESIADEMRLSKSINRDQLGKNFSSIVDSILADVKSNKEAISLLSDVFLYDNYIFAHSLNVTIYSLGLALEMKLSDKQLKEIGLGAMLHDVGKMAIPPEILNKPGRLTDEEFDVIKRHPKAGFDLLRNIPNMPLLAAHCAFQHHERLNGSGYPRNLTSSDIHLYAKIIGIADVFDAVTSHRVYRKAMLPHEGLEILYAGAGTQFDKDMLEAFARTVAMYPVGLTVDLSDGRKAVVVKQNQHMSARPVVRIIEENDQELPEPYEIDLMVETNITIVETEATLADG